MQPRAAPRASGVCLRSAPRASAANRAALDRIRDYLAASAAHHLDLPAPTDAGAFLNNIHQQVDGARLNDLRLAVFHDINTQDWLRPAYFATARDSVQTLIGNELAMQKRINLSVQMPDDDKSVLPVHADVWSGDSAFEAVLWVPFVDVFASKSMFIASPAKNAEIAAINAARDARRRLRAARGPGERAFLYLASSTSESFASLVVATPYCAFESILSAFSLSSESPAP